MLKISFNVPANYSKVKKVCVLITYQMVLASNRDLYKIFITLFLSCGDISNLCPLNITIML